jgi:site-specific DNA recombinase
MRSAVGYVRVSTGEQAQEGISLEMQAAKIRAYCQLNDLTLTEIIEDVGVSAKNMTGRPGFQKALAMLFCGKTDALVVYKLDRAFRSTRDALDVAEALNKKAKGLHSITEKLDTSSAVGEFFFTLMASLAQMERKLIGERTAAALAQKRANGEKTGGQCPYGFRSVDGKLVPDVAEQSVVNLIKSFRAAGESTRSIARRLHEEGFTTRKGTAFSQNQVFRILKAAA